MKEPFDIEDENVLDYEDDTFGILDPEEVDTHEYEDIIKEESYD